MPAPGSPLRVPHKGWGASVGVKHAPGRMERDGRAQMSAVLAGRGEGGPHPALAPRRVCGMPRLGARMGSCALCGSLPRGELFKQSFSSSEPPRSALPTRPGSCRCRQSRRRGSGGGGSVPRWAQSCVAPGFACEAVLGAGARSHTRTVLQ